MIIENNMRNYLKRQGINIRKGKSWTLKSKKEKVPLGIKSWYAGYNNKSLFYSVRQKNLEVCFQGDVGYETCLSYTDGTISFMVDSIRNSVRLQEFVVRWIKDLKSKNYKGSWRNKKTKLETKSKKDKAIEIGLFYK